MKINNSLDFDLDLFFICSYYFFFKYPFIGHFATGGLKVSDKNFFTNNHNDFRSHILSNKGLKFEYKLNPNLEKIISYKREIDTEFNLENYTRDFIKYAQCGLFSFDRTYIDDSIKDSFHLVAYPIINSFNEEILFEYLTKYKYYLSHRNFIRHRKYSNINDFININFSNSIKIKM